MNFNLNQKNRTNFSLNNKSDPLEIPENQLPEMLASKITSFPSQTYISNQNVFQPRTDNGNNIFNTNNTNVGQLTHKPFKNEQIIVKEKEEPGKKTIIEKTKYMVDGKEVTEEEMKNFLKKNENIGIYTKKITTNPKITTSTTTTTTTTTITNNGKITTTKTENITKKENIGNDNHLDNKENNKAKYIKDFLVIY